MKVSSLYPLRFEEGGIGFTQVRIPEANRKELKAKPAKGGG
jgi:hypothetical protein